MTTVSLPTYEKLLAEALRSLAVDSGVVGSPVPVGGNSLSDTSKVWAANIHKNRLVKVISKQGYSQQALIGGNGFDTLRIVGVWARPIAPGDTYVILGIDFAQILRDVFSGGIDIDLPAEFAELKASLMTALEASIDSGTATGGSNTTIVDTGKSWAADMWVGATFEVMIGTTHYLGLVVNNTADTITFASLAGGAVVVAGCEYSLKRPVTLADISDRAARLLGVVQSLTQWGGTALTGRDISGRGLGFSGVTYVNSDTATSDAARRFETTSKKLRDVVIYVETNDQLFGDASAQTFPVATGSSLGITQIDVSTLYFRNKTAGQNGTVHILAVED